jgi:hypothetical protein
MGVVMWFSCAFWAALQCLQRLHFIRKWQLDPGNLLGLFMAFARQQG